MDMSSDMTHEHCQYVEVLCFCIWWHHYIMGQHVFCPSLLLVKTKQHCSALWSLNLKQKGISVDRTSTCFGCWTQAETVSVWWMTSSSLCLCDEYGWPVLYCVFVKSNFIFGFSSCNSCQFNFKPTQFDHFNGWIWMLFFCGWDF